MNIYISHLLQLVWAGSTMGRPNIYNRTGQAMYV